jgi:hypothetical protein
MAMNAHDDKSRENTSKAVAHGLPKLTVSSEVPSAFIDNRPQTIAQRKLQMLANEKAGVIQQKEVKPAKFPANLPTGALQGVVQQKSALPEQIKAGAESYSGIAMDDVSVFYNSSKPTQLQAHAYAAGNEIHIAPGQEKHIAHEAWHVVQQKQGRVSANKTLNGAGINTQESLESEADAMGSRIAQFRVGNETVQSKREAGSSNGTIQRMLIGFDSIDSWQLIDAGWVDAYIADITHQFAHLYQEDLVRYLDTNHAGWTNDAELINHGNHWDVRIDKHNDTVITITTVADGNCGAYAIHAIANRGNFNADRDGYDSPGNFVEQVRNWIQANPPSRDEIKQRIFQEIQDSEYAVLTGFGPQLMEIISGIEFKARFGGENAENPSALEKGVRFGTVVFDDNAQEVYLFDGVANRCIAIPEEQWGELQNNQHVQYLLTNKDNDEGKVIKINEGNTLASRIQMIVMRLGILTEESLSKINTKPEKNTQISAADIILSFCVEFVNLTSELSTMPKQTVVSSVFMPEEWSACYSTAAKLFALLKKGSGKDNYANGRLDQAGFNEDAMNDNQETVKLRSSEMGRLLVGLMEDMASSKTSRIYNCGFGIHGFCFILRGGQVELLQSFANGLKYKLPAITVAESIMLNKTFKAGQMIEILKLMGGNEEERTQAQMRLFQTTIETGEQPFPLCQFYWEGANLAEEQDIDLVLTQRISKNYLIMQQMLHLLGKKLVRMKEVHELLGKK